MLIKCLTLCPLGTVNIVIFFEKTAVFTVFFHIGQGGNHSVSTFSRYHTPPIK